MIVKGEDIVWEEPKSFQELLRLRRLKRRSFWRNARPLFINTALIFSLVMIFFAFYYRSDIAKVFEPAKIISALIASFDANLRNTCTSFRHRRGTHTDRWVARRSQSAR